MYQFLINLAKETFPECSIIPPPPSESGSMQTHEDMINSGEYRIVIAKSHKRSLAKRTFKIRLNKNYLFIFNESLDLSNPNADPVKWTYNIIDNYEKFIARREDDGQGD